MVNKSQNPKSRRVMVRLTAAEYDIVTGWASRTGKRLSAALRDIFQAGVSALLPIEKKVYSQTEMRKHYRESQQDEGLVIDPTTRKIGNDKIKKTAIGYVYKGSKRFHLIPDDKIAKLAFTSEELATLDDAE